MKFTYSCGQKPLEGYEVKRGIGRGGFGEVYFGLSDGGKEVALKVIQSHLDIELRGIHQCLNGKGEGIPQTAGMVCSKGSGSPPGFHLAGQQAKDLSERQVGITNAGVGIAVPTSNDQVRMSILRAVGEFPDECGLATARFPGDEDHPSLPFQRTVQEPAQLP